MKHVFMDTNVVIDFLTNRQPFVLDAAKLFDMAVKEKIKIYISALSYGNIHYVVKRSFGNNMAISLLNELAEMTEIVDVTKSIIRQSLKTDFKDYEDAIQYYCALSVEDISLIVTRDTKDFKKSTLAILTPAEAFAALR
ncbi:PIN domain-containing protein [Mucilaginibacter sp. ZT4R22]|uniref:PIN domain-containing protein n=1 Tax=Mucilaginibacter pankratovii TaxID=2772110 RepID=A0ABR7WP70_9SPHI|nr:PIN domain-containing protein [Mucilaginibacter pankratovii]MBD1364121.1 PIN domain-containing protein [Mucilaginibacter pankratovii]